MITLTDRAAGQLRTLLQERNLPGHGLRVMVQGGGCAGLEYVLTFEQDAGTHDTVLDCQGIQLFVDRFSAQYLAGASIDFQETRVGGGFVVDNPNAIATCACGSSFRTRGEREVEQTCDP